MKTNNLKLLLLSSLLLATSCQSASNNEQQTQQQSSSSQVESSSSQVVSSSESVSETESSSSVSESSSSSVEEQVENPKIKIEMNRKIYLRDEFNARKAIGLPALDYSSISVWSDALQDFKTSGASPTISIPEGNGPVKAKVTLGRLVTYIDIQVFDTAEQAALANPVSSEDLASATFKESIYFDSGKKKTKDDTYYDANTGKIMQAVAIAPLEYIDDELQFRTASYTWATNRSYAFSSGEKNTLTSELDPTKKIATHEALAQNVVLNTTMGKYVHEITQTNKASTFVFRIDESVEDTGYANNTEIGNVNYEQEMIVDAQGRICYLGIVFEGDSYKHVALSDLNNYYVDPYYQSNDYSTLEGVAANTNPAFVFASDYDPNDEVKKYNFEKVIPEGGYHIVNANNKYGYSTTGEAWSDIDIIWDAVTGFTSTVRDSVSYWNREAMETNEADTGFNAKVSSSIITYKHGLCTTSTVKYTKSMVVYQEADTYRKFAYLYKLALDSKDAAQIAKHDVVVDAIKYQQVKAIKDEPVLFDYYASLTEETLADWQANLITTGE